MQWVGGGKLQSPLARAMIIPGSDGAMEDCQTLSRRSLLLQAASLLVLSVATVPRPVAATAGGGLLGGLGSTALLYGLGTSGLAAPGITSGLAAAGGGVAAALGALGVTVVSPMVAGVAVLAVPVLAGGASLGWVANKIKGRGTKPVEKLEYAIQELKTIEARLKPRRHFRSEIAEIKAYVKEFEGQKSRLA